MAKRTPTVIGSVLLLWMSLLAPFCYAGGGEEGTKVRILPIKGCDPALLERMGKVRWWGWPYRNTMGVLKKKEGATESVAIVRGYLKEKQLCLENIVTGRQVTATPVPNGARYGERAGYSAWMNNWAPNPRLSPNGRCAALGTTDDAYTVLDLFEAKPIRMEAKTGCDMTPYGFAEDGNTAIVEWQGGNCTYLCGPDGKAASVRGRFPQMGASTGHIYRFWVLWDETVEKEKNVAVVRCFGRLAAAQLSQDEKLLAVVCRQSGSTATLRAMEMKEQKWLFVSRIEDLPDVAPMVIFPPTGKEIVVLGGERAFVFRAEDGKMLTRFVAPPSVELVGFLEEAGKTQLVLMDRKEMWLYGFSEIVGASNSRPTALTPELQLVWKLMNPEAKDPADQVLTALQLAATKADENAALEGAMWLLKSDAATQAVVPKVLDLLEADPPYGMDSVLVRLLERFPRAIQPEDATACTTAKALRRILAQLKPGDKRVLLTSLLKTGDDASREAVADLVNESPGSPWLESSAYRELCEVAKEDEGLRATYLKHASPEVRYLGLTATIEAFEAKHKRWAKAEIPQPDLVELGTALSVGMGDTLGKARSTSAKRFETFAAQASKDGPWAPACDRSAKQLLDRQMETVATDEGVETMGHALAGLTIWHALNDQDHKPAVEFLVKLMASEKSGMRASAIRAIGQCHGRLASARDALLSHWPKELKAYGEDRTNMEKVTAFRSALSALGKLDSPPAALPGDVLTAFEAMQGKGTVFVPVFSEFPAAWGKAYPQRTLKVLFAEVEREPGLSCSYLGDALKGMLPEIGLELEKHRDSEVELIRKLVEDVLGR